MAENSSNVGIKKLDKDNFQPWKFRMRNYLIGKDLWGFVTGEYEEPILFARDVTTEELKAWKTWNEKGEEGDVSYLTKCVKWDDWTHTK